MIETESNTFRRALFAGMPVSLALLFFMLPLMAQAFYLLPVPAYVAIIYALMVLMWCLWCAAAPIYYLVTSRKWRALSPVAAGILFAVLWWHFNSILHAADIAKIYVFRGFYDHCAKSAVDVGQGVFFNVCEDHSLTMTTEDVIYDTSTAADAKDQNASFERYRKISSLFKEYSAQSEAATRVDVQRLTGSFSKIVFYFD